MADGKEFDVQLSSGKVTIFNTDFEPVDSVEGLSKFYLYTEVSSEFEVTTGGLGDSQEKVTITVNNNGDEVIPEPSDTGLFDPDTNTEPGITEMITPSLDGNESTE